MNAHASPAPGSCPDLQTLRRFQQGTVDARTLTTLANHIADCDLCVSVLDSLQESTPNDDLVAAIRQCYEQTPNERTPSEGTPEGDGRGYAAIAAAALRYVADPPTLPEERTAASVAELEDTPAPPKTSARPRRVGPYEILDTIGGGGMGVVYRARQTLIDRDVALKMIVGGVNAAPQMVRRFHTEGKAVARLRHANVVEIYDFDECDGQPYLAMELLEGGSLAHRLREGPLPVRAAAELVRALAQGVEAAHQAGVLHRDLKPSNVLLGSSGVPKITDFGLAKLLDSDDVVHTQTEAILGTPAYMSPEQAAGKTKMISARTDVYALGVILYECLTGKPLFRGEDKARTLKMVRSTEPVPPSKLRREIPRNLEAICLKCLEKSPARRYASAQTLGEDLDLWLRNERPRGTPRILEQALRGIRRHVAVIGLGLVACSVAMALPLFNPDRRVDEIQAELAEGREVTLIADKGGPRWLRWVRGDNNSTIEILDGYFTVHTPELALVELVPDMKTSHFEFSARVKHVHGTRGGQVGLFVARQSYPAGPREIHFVIVHGYNDLHRLEDVPIVLPPTVKKRPPGMRTPSLYPYLMLQRGPNPGFGSRMSGRSGPLYKIGTAEDGWRDLHISVSPEGVVARWDGEEIPLTKEKIAQSVDNSLNQKDIGLKARMRENAFVQDLNPEFEPSGGIGLYVDNSSASYRDVSVKGLR